jgi:hypothetical protein
VLCVVVVEVVLEQVGKAVLECRQWVYKQRCARVTRWQRCGFKRLHRTYCLTYGHNKLVGLA